MSVYLTIKVVEDYKSEVQEEFETITGHPRFAGRKNSKQWQFFRHCFNVLMGKSRGDFECGERQAIDYKYEINDRLQRYYLSFGKPIKFVFHLINDKKAGPLDYDEADYPSCNGYKLRVSSNKDLPDVLQKKRLLIEKTIADAMDAEFEVYRRVPDLDFTRLAEVFDVNGSAYKWIVNLAKKHKKRGWTFRNEMNPSTKRLIDLRIRDISESSAEAWTSEYWLLMWWSVIDKKYAHTYKEVNRQTYHLIWRDDKWLVKDNIYDKPKTSTPRRNIRNR